MAGTINPEAFTALAAGLLAQVQQEQQPQSQSTAFNSTPAVARATTSRITGEMEWLRKYKHVAKYGNGLALGVLYLEMQALIKSWYLA